jgi:hypothetical protein
MSDQSNRPLTSKAVTYKSRGGYEVSVSRLHPGEKVIAAVNPVRPEGGAQAQHCFVAFRRVYVR